MGPFEKAKRFPQYLFLLSTKPTICAQVASSPQRVDDYRLGEQCSVVGIYRRLMFRHVFDRRRPMFLGRRRDMADTAFLPAARPAFWMYNP